MISIIIPTYNERENVPIIVKKIADAMKKTNEKYEIVIVDDNSHDGTARIAKALAKKYPIIIVSRRGKLGLASAVMAGVKKAKGDRIIVMDADLSHPPEKLPLIVKALEEYDIVIGSRNIKGGGVETWTFDRKLISKGATVLANVAIGINVSDPMSGFFGVRRKILENTKIRVKGYKILMNILAKNKNLKIKEIPYFFKDRVHGETKLGAGEIVNYVVDLVRLKF